MNGKSQWSTSVKILVNTVKFQLTLDLVYQSGPLIFIVQFGNSNHNYNKLKWKTELRVQFGKSKLRSTENIPFAGQTLTLIYKSGPKLFIFTVHFSYRNHISLVYQSGQQNFRPIWYTKVKVE